MYCILGVLLQLQMSFSASPSFFAVLLRPTLGLLGLFSVQSDLLQGVIHRGDPLLGNHVRSSAFKVSLHTSLVL